MNEVKAIHISVDGHVQGVGFRYFVKEKADMLNLVGWVRNRYDGSVEIEAQGEEQDLQELLTTVQTGPSRSMVTNFKYEWLSTSPTYSQFSILPSE